jgi:hypothetical protein
MKPFKKSRKWSDEHGVFAINLPPPSAYSPNRQYTLGYAKPMFRDWIVTMPQRLFLLPLFVLLVAMFAVPVGGAVGAD